MHLVIQSFGRDSEYRRAILTILSFYAHIQQPAKESHVILFTDDPAYFKAAFRELPIEYILLTEQKIRAMRGHIDFLHRMKVALIEEAFEITGGDLLYADSDTFFIADPQALMATLNKDQSYMHTREYAFDYLRDLPLPGGAPFQAFYQLLKNGRFRLANGDDIQIPTGLASWNAGVMMFHRSHRQLIPDVYALTDQFYPATQNHASEQYAFSIMLQLKTELAACEPVIYHYWYRIKKQIIDRFLAHEMVAAWQNSPLDYKLTDVKKWCRTLPGCLDTHVLTLRDQAIRALNEKRYSEGYGWAAKALLKEPLGDKTFIKDILYHLKRQLSRK